MPNELELEPIAKDALPSKLPRDGYLRSEWGLVCDGCDLRRRRMLPSRDMGIGNSRSDQKIGVESAESRNNHCDSLLQPSKPREPWSENRLHGTCRWATRKTAYPMMPPTTIAVAAHGPSPRMSPSGCPILWASLRSLRSSIFFLASVPHGYRLHLEMSAV
jgi:hypothetical protein